MRDAYNSAIVKKTLQKTLQILDSRNAEYRMLGSVVTAAILGKQHRKLGDLDFIADTSQRDYILKELSNLGYKPKTGMFSFARKHMAMDNLDQDDLLEIGFFWGKFQPDGSFLMGNKKHGLLIDSFAVRKQKYSLHDIQLIGLPKTIIAKGIVTSPNNPKRKKELALIKKQNIQPEKRNYIHTFVFGFQVDWLYHLTMSLLNVLGNIRVKLGLPFDPWR